MDQDREGPNVPCSPGPPTRGGPHLKNGSECRTPNRPFQAHLSRSSFPRVFRGYTPQFFVHWTKNRKINSARRGLRRSWGDMAESEDLLPLHHKKPLTQRQALAMAHLHFDPIQSQPFLSSVLKLMYRYLRISTSLANEMEGRKCMQL